MGERVFVIAEAGVNHNGDLDLGRRLVDAAADAGADAVKFQSFRADQLVSASAPKAQYQTRTTDPAESQQAMISQLELAEDDHRALIEHAHARSIAFLSTPFDPSSLALLTGRFGLETIKIGSGELTNTPLLAAAASVSQHLIVSTGMGSLAEVEQALAAIAFGFTAEVDAMPTDEDLDRAYSSELGQQQLRERVTLLHCTTEYPAPVAEVNLRAMATLSEAFALRVGYSDHTIGLHVAIAAAARGAVVIEKHHTLDRSLPGPDHAASLEPDELRAMVTQIREIEQAMGDGIKRPTASEWANREVARKSLVAARDIVAGEAFTTENLVCKRPGNGISPTRYWAYLGRCADRDYAADEVIR